MAQHARGFRGRAAIVTRLFACSVFAEDSDDVFHRNDKEAIIAFEVNWNAVLGVEEHTVVALDRVVVIPINFGADRNDASGQGGDLNLVGQVNARLGLLLIVVLAYQHTLADRLDNFDGTR